MRRRLAITLTLTALCMGVLPAQAVEIDPGVDFLFVVGSTTELPEASGPGEIRVKNEDVVQFVDDAHSDVGPDGEDGFEIFIDGSDVGIKDAAIDAFAVLDPEPSDAAPEGRYLMSFTAPEKINGLNVDDSDIVMFNASSLGESTDGTFELWLDGSDIGLTTGGEDVDAIHFTDGQFDSLSFSTTGNFSIPASLGGPLDGRDEDIVVCGSEIPDTDPEDFACSSLVIEVDGTDSGLDEPTEDVDALDFVSTDTGVHMILSTTGDFEVPGAAGADHDLFACLASGVGPSPPDECEGPPDIEFRSWFTGYPHDIKGDITAVATILPE